MTASARSRINELSGNRTPAPAAKVVVVPHILPDHSGFLQSSPPGPYRVPPIPALRYPQVLDPRSRLYSREAEPSLTLTSLDFARDPSTSAEKLSGSQMPSRPSPPNELPKSVSLPYDWNAAAPPSSKRYLRSWACSPDATKI